MNLPERLRGLGLHSPTQAAAALEKLQQYVDHANRRCTDEKCVCGLTALLKEVFNDE